jgi:hypothetical protein
MRTLLVGLGLSAILACGSTARAQSPGQQAYEKDEMRGAVHQLTPAERVHERAAVEANARLARIESKHAMGISPQRPTMGPPMFLYRHEHLISVAPWGFYGACAVPYGIWLP